MKCLIVPVVVFTAVLSGCAVVAPYEQPYAVYSSSPAYPQPYTVLPGYVMPAPVYRPPVYIGPPVHFSFGLNYWRGHGDHHHGYRHGFGGPRFGFRGGWRH